MATHDAMLYEVTRYLSSLLWSNWLSVVFDTSLDHCTCMLGMLLLVMSCMFCKYMNSKT